MQHWHNILSTALLTPSPHNTQPWRVQLHDATHATVFMDGRRTLPDEDTTGAFLMSAMGMFLTALQIAAQNAGYSLITDVATSSNAAMRKIANIRLAPATGPKSLYDHATFEKRATSRLHSNGVKMAPDVVTLLRQFAPESGQRYHHIDDPKLIEAIIQKNIHAVFFDFNNPLYHDEIARWYRYSDAESRSKRDGLDRRCMQLTRIELHLLISLPRLMLWPITRPLIHRIYRRQIGRVDHIGVIDGPFFENDAALRAGDYLLRFWLELARHDLGMHPFGNLVTNPDAHAWFKQTTGIAKPWLIFRIGYTETPPHSYRLDLKDILLNETPASTD